MESKCDHFCEIVTENHKPITVLDSNQFAFRFRAEQKRALQHDQLVSALSVSDTVDFEQIAADLVISFGRKSPVSVLMQHAQYTRSKVNFVEVGEPDGPHHKPMYVVLKTLATVPSRRYRRRRDYEYRPDLMYLSMVICISSLVFDMG